MARRASCPLAQGKYEGLGVTKLPLAERCDCREDGSDVHEGRGQPLNLREDEPVCPNQVPSKRGLLTVHISYIYLPLGDAVLPGGASSSLCSNPAPVLQPKS